MIEDVRAQQLVPPIGRTGIFDIGHPVEVEAGQQWVWVADILMTRGHQTNHPDWALRRYWSLNGTATDQGWGFWGGASTMTNVLPGADAQTISAVITVPGEWAGEPVARIQPVMRSYVTVGAAVARNLIIHRIA